MAPQDSQYAGPINMFPGGANKSYPNPYHSLPLQFLPLQMDHMLWWSQHMLFRFGFYKTALQRVADYFITSLNIETDGPEEKKKYEEAFEEGGWREELGLAGLNTLASGNEFVSINQGFTRFLKCQQPNCGRLSEIKHIKDFEFSKNKYVWKCPKCKVKGVHQVVDSPSRSLEDLQVVHWPAREIKIRCDEHSGTYEYYWDIPQDYATKVSKKNDKFYPKCVSTAVYDCIFAKGGRRMLLFNENNFLHLKVSTPSSIKTDGKAVPPCMFLFDDFFTLQCLKRFNEVIMMEDINPFRVLSMDFSAGSNPKANPIFNQDGGEWSEQVDAMIEEHRRDPGSYHKFPFPLKYDQLGGEGKELAPTELMAQAKNDILGALNIPQELYTMTLSQQNAVTPALRLFENAWAMLPRIYGKFLQHWADVISKVRGLQPAKVSVTRITISDDLERKSVIGQLVGANAIARSTLLEMYDLDFRDQLKKKIEEDRIQKEEQEEEAEKESLQEANQNNIVGANGQQSQTAPGGGAASSGSSSPDDVLQNAAQLAQQLFPLPAAERRTQLQQIKAQNETLWSATKTALQELTSQAKSNGVASAQQSQQAGGTSGGQQPGAQ